VSELRLFSQAIAFNLKHNPEAKHKLTLKLKRNVLYLGRKERKLVKLKHELDKLKLDIKQWGLKLYSLILNKEQEVGQPLFFIGACHENHEVNCNLPPWFDELEVKELQVFDLEPCGVVEEFESFCLYLQQELRTILFTEKGSDVYFHRYIFILTTQFHSWQDPYEFMHGEALFGLYYLNFIIKDTS